MKKLLSIILLSLSINSFAQNIPINGNITFDIGSGFTDGIFSIRQRNLPDSLFAMFINRAKFFKPVLPGTYTTSGAPSASLFPGYIIYNSDSSKLQWSNGSSWQTIYSNNGSGGGGGGGTPGGSGSEFQYRVDGSTFGGAAGTAWDNTNSLFTMTKGSLGVTQTLNTGWLLQNNTAASSGNQQISPAYWMDGRGWETTGGTSQSVRIGMDVLPVQGTTTTGTLRWLQSVNGGALSTVLSYATGSHTLQLGTSTTLGRFNLTSDATTYIRRNGNVFHIIAHTGLSSRSGGTMLAYPGTTETDPNSYTNGFFNALHTTLPQFTAVYNTTNYTTLGTNSSGDFTIVPSGGDLAITGNATVSSEFRINTSDQGTFSLQNTGSLYQNGSVALHGVPNMTSPNVILGKTTSSDSVVRGITIADLRTALNLVEGTYSPTATGISNYDGNFVVSRATYSRNGSMVRVWMDVGIGATTGSTETEIEITLPIASAITNGASLIGAGINYNDVTKSAYVKGNATTDKAIIHFTANVAAGFNNYNIFFDYEIF